MSRLGPLGALLLLVLGIGGACGASDTTPPLGINVGQRAPDFELESLEGRAISLADYAGHVVLINFWATWCAPCELEMPDLEKAYQAHKGDSVVVLGLNVEESAEVVKTFVAEKEVTFPVLLDVNGQVAKQYRLLGLPMTLFVDRQGVIQVRHIGYLSAGQLKNYLARLLP